MTKLLFLLCSIHLLTGCINVFKLTDLRTEVSKQKVENSKAKDLVMKMGKAHGIENWAKMDTYSVLFQDEFFGALGKFSCPFDTIQSTFTLSYIPNVFDGSLRFENGKAKGETWGIHQWNTYEVNNELDTVFKKNKDATFWLPTYQYFIEFPLRIQTATAFQYAGKTVINGVNCEGVIASWNIISPQKKIDQYLIWLDAETNQIVKLEYTIRDIYKFVKGATYFKDYMDAEGVLIPQLLSVESNLVKEGYLHEMRILNLTANKLEKSQLQLGKNLIKSNPKSD